MALGGVPGASQTGLGVPPPPHPKPTEGPGVFLSPPHPKAREPWGFVPPIPNWGGPRGVPLDQGWAFHPKSQTGLAVFQHPSQIWESWGFVPPQSQTGGWIQGFEPRQIPNLPAFFHLPSQTGGVLGFVPPVLNWERVPSLSQTGGPKDASLIPNRGILGGVFVSPPLPNWGSPSTDARYGAGSFPAVLSVEAVPPQDGAEPVQPVLLPGETDSCPEVGLGSCPGRSRLFPGGAGGDTGSLPGRFFPPPHGEEPLLGPSPPELSGS